MNQLIVKLICGVFAILPVSTYLLNEFLVKRFDIDYANNISMSFFIVTIFVCGLVFSAKQVQMFSFLSGILLIFALIFSYANNELQIKGFIISVVQCISVIAFILFVKCLTNKQCLSFLSFISIFHMMVICLSIGLIFLANGNLSITLMYIELPLFVLSCLHLHLAGWHGRYWWVLGFYMLCLGIIAIAMGDHRIQALPLGICLMGLIASTLVRYRINILIPILLLSIIGFFFLVSPKETALALGLENRWGSGYERFEIFKAMSDKSVFFMLPQGLGSGLIEFPVVQWWFNDRIMYYKSHSGLFGFLFEFGMFGWVCLVLAFYYFLKSKKGSRWFRRWNFFCLIIFLIHNVFYFKGFPGPMYLSFSGFVIYWLIFQCREDSKVR